ncbi:MAG TPA: hypothetical protein VGO01_25010 [Bradyrhizobium sp.]|jgi:hypothetical protein|nr:hypothetical protein [Bradyrhizobium sp.]
MNFDALSAIARIEMSVDPPAGQGTISVIGLVGYSCASAGHAKIAAAAIAMIKRLPCNIEFLFRIRPAIGRGAKCLRPATRNKTATDGAGQSTTIMTALQGGACGITSAHSG